MRGSARGSGGAVLFELDGWCGGAFRAGWVVRWCFSSGMSGAAVLKNQDPTRKIAESGKFLVCLLRSLTRKSCSFNVFLAQPHQKRTRTIPVLREFLARIPPRRTRKNAKSKVFLAHRIEGGQGKTRNPRFSLFTTSKEDKEKCKIQGFPCSPHRKGDKENNEI